MTKILRFFLFLLILSPSLVYSHPLEGFWIGHGWSLIAEQKQLGASWFYCQVDQNGYFVCDNMAGKRPERKCLIRGNTFYGEILELNDPVFLVHYWNWAKDEIPPPITSLTSLISDEDHKQVTIETIMDEQGNMKNFLEHSTLTKVSDNYNVEIPLSFLRNYKCDE